MILTEVKFFSDTLTLGSTMNVLLPQRPLAEMQKKLPGGVIWDIAYVGSIANHLPRQVNLNAVPYGARFLPQNQDPTLPASTLPGQNAYDANFLRPYQGFGRIQRRHRPRRQDR